MDEHVMQMIAKGFKIAGFALTGLSAVCTIVVSVCKVVIESNAGKDSVENEGS